MSQRKISHLRHKIYGKLIALNAQNNLGLEINRDSLHRVYEVNRHCIVVEGKASQNVARLRDLLCQSLVAEGWTTTEEHGLHKFGDYFVLAFEGTTMSLFIHKLVAGHARFDLSPGTV